MGSIAERGLCLALALTFFVPPNLLWAQDLDATKRQPQPRELAKLETLDGLDAIDVDPRTGGVLYQRTDLVVGEANLAFPLRRTYRPYGGDQANLGLNWASTLDVHLDLHPKRTRASFQDEQGRRYFFERDKKSEQLVSVSGPFAQIRELADGYVVRDLGDGRVYRFDQRGQLRRREGPTSLRIDYRYDKRARLRVVEGPWGKIELRRDERGRLAEISAPGKRSVRYRYDAEGNLTKVLKSTEFETYSYDTSGRLTGLAGGKAQIAYDAVGRVVRLGGTALRALKVRYPQSTGNEWAESTVLERGELVERFDYSVDGRKVRHTDPKGGVSITEFDERERLVRYQGADGRELKQRYDERGRLEARLDPKGTTRYYYESKVTHKPTRVHYPDGRELRYRYDVRGNVLEATLPGGAKVRYRYDAAGRMVEMVDRRGAKTTFLRDAQGFVLEIDEEGVGKTSFLRDPAGRLLKVKKPDGRIVTVEQAPGGRKIKVRDALGVVQEVHFDARRRVTFLRDEHGNDYRYEYGQLGELLEVRHGGELHYAFRYDESGQVDRIVDGNGNQTLIRREGRKVVVTSPSQGAVVTEEDAAGRVLKETREGVTVHYRYDERGNLAERKTPRGSERFDYDERGRLRSISGPDGGYELSYDDAGRITGLTNSALKQTIGYAYDAAGDRVGMKLPWGQVRYERDVQGRLTGLKLPSGDQLQIEVHPDGRRKAIRYPNGVETRFYYQKARLEAVVTRKGEDELDRRVYGYDERGRVAWTEGRSKQRTTYGYDTRNRLTSADGPHGKLRYVYDAAGNRTAIVAEGKTERVEVGPGNRVLKQGEARYTYTKSGALESKTTAAGTTRYAYDHDDRLVEVVRPDKTTIRYGYAPNGTRMWRKVYDAEGKRVEDEVTHYLHDMADVVGEISADGTLRTSYVHGDGNDDVLSAQRGEESFFYHYDRVRSVTSVTGADGAVAARYSYDAFGKAREVEGAAAAWNPYRFTSRTFDAQAELYHYRARYYAPELGRFTTTDPTGIAGGVNLYTYVNNDPLRFNDPDGLWPKWLDRAVEGTVNWVDRNVVEPVAQVAAWTHENVIKPVADAAVYTGKQLYAFGKGFVKGVANVVVGLYQFVRHPIQTLKAVYKAIENWDETKEALLAVWEEYKDAAVNDPEKFAEMTGQLTAEVLLAVVSPTKGLTAVTGIAKTAATTAKVANNLERVSRVARVVTNPVTRNAARAGTTLARNFPRTARVVRNARVMSRARNIEKARRAAEVTPLLRRVPRRLGYVGRDLYNGGRLAVTRPGSYAVYAGLRTANATSGLFRSTGRGIWKGLKYGTIPTTVVFKDNITDALDAYENREAALRDVRGKAKSFLNDAGNLTPEELAARIEELGGTYSGYRNRLMGPVHDEDKRLEAALQELDRKVANGEIPDNTIDSRLNALLEEYGRRRHNLLVDIYDRNREEDHDMFNPSINRTISFQDEIDLLEEAKKKVSDPAAKALIEARQKDLTELMAYEYDLFKRGDHDVLIAGIAGPPREEDGTIPGQPSYEGGEPENYDYQPGMLDSMEGYLDLENDYSRD